MRCRLLGHRWRFRAEGETLRWSCERGCGAGGEKRYDSAERAQRYANAFDQGDSTAPGRRFPFPLPQAVFRNRRGGS